MGDYNMKSKDPASYLRAFVERVKKDNATFEAASLEEKQCIIARDVLLLLQHDMIMPVRCSYGPTESSYHVRSDESLRDVYIREGLRCEGCVRGAIVYSTVLRRNKVYGEWLDGSEEDLEEFPLELLRILEAAYEGDIEFVSESSWPDRDDPEDVPIFDTFHWLEDFDSDRINFEDPHGGFFPFSGRPEFLDKFAQLRLIMALRLLIREKGKFCLRQFCRELRDTVSEVKDVQAYLEEFYKNPLPDVLPCGDT